MALAAALRNTAISQQAGNTSCLPEATPWGSCCVSHERQQPYRCMINLVYQLLPNAEAKISEEHPPTAVGLHLHPRSLVNSLLSKSTELQMWWDDRSHLNPQETFVPEGCYALKFFHKLVNSDSAAPKMKAMTAIIQVNACMGSWMFRAVSDILGFYPILHY